MLCRNSVGVIFRGIGRHLANNVSPRRKYISPAYQCADSWRKRLDTPVIKKCVLDDFFYDLDAKYTQTENINAIDVDIFVNAVKDSAHLDEMQDLVHKLRLSPEAGNIMPSTHHGLIRAFLDCKKYDDLMSILNDRLNYGIFPDDFCNLLMLDRFLKEKDYKNAAKVATLQMLQEDFSNPLIIYLSLYSCHQYLLHPTKWDKAKEETAVEDEEVVKVRVGYLRNPYFDEHFDLHECNDLIGKTFISIGKELNNTLGMSYELLGYILFNKLPLAKTFLKCIIQQNHKIHKDIFLLISKHLEDTSSHDNKSANSENYENLMQEISSNILVDDKEILPLVEENIMELVKKSENALVVQQENIYQEWINARDQLLNESLDKIKKEQRLQEVLRVKEELVRKEEELFFFNREDQLDLKIEKKLLQTTKSQDDKQKGQSNTDDYVPPDIEKRKHVD